jgi:hypothetical protein
VCFGALRARHADLDPILALPYRPAACELPHYEAGHTKGSSDNRRIGLDLREGSLDSRFERGVVSCGMIDEDSLCKLEARRAAILPELDERQRRLFAAAEARAAGPGGIAAVSRVTRIAASTIGAGVEGTGRAGCVAARSGPPARRGTRVADRDDPPSARRLERLGRARRARRSDVAAALDLQESAPSVRGTGQARTPDQPHAATRSWASC